MFGMLGPNGPAATTVESIAGCAGPTAARCASRARPQKDRDQLRTVVGIQLQESELPERIDRRPGRRSVRVVLAVPDVQKP